jgi:flagellar hook-basal body complex protein FliE
MSTIPVNTIEVPQVTRPERSSEPTAPAHGADFGQELSSALNGVEKLQLQADDEAAKAALGGGNLHELSLALEKADVAMRVATKVRNKLVDAYHEIMRMSV